MSSNALGGGPYDVEYGYSWLRNPGFIAAALVGPAVAAYHGIKY